MTIAIADAIMARQGDRRIQPQFILAIWNLILVFGGCLCFNIFVLCAHADAKIKPSGRTMIDGLAKVKGNPSYMLQRIG